MNDESTKHANSPCQRKHPARDCGHTCVISWGARAHVCYGIVLPLCPQPIHRARQTDNTANLGRFCHALANNG